LLLRRIIVFSFESGWRYEWRVPTCRMTALGCRSYLAWSTPFLTHQ
jgi:hypothetical protein